MMKHTLLTLFMFLSLLCHGQSYKFFTTDRELSSSLINKIYQDRNGMIWIATEDGLNRYDGAKFVIYKHDPENEHSLCHNYVRALYEDSKGRLFVGTYNGIQLYDPATDSFSTQAQWEDGKTFDSNIMSILECRNGEIWGIGKQLVYHNHHTGETDCTQTGFTYPHPNDRLHDRGQTTQSLGNTG